MKKIIIILILFIGAILLLILRDSSPQPTQEDIVGDPFTSFCYYTQSPNENGFDNTTWLRVENTSDETGQMTLAGEFHNISSPADDVRGIFVGEYRVEPEDSSLLEARTILTLQSEGIDSLQEFVFTFNPNILTLATGERIDRGDGLLIYQNQDNLNFSQEIPSIACDDLQEKIAVETYIQNNISDLSLVDSVHGGTWYTVSIDININENTGTVVYEDGHIQETANFLYNYTEGIATVEFANN